MKLYMYEHCPFCARVRMVCGLKNLSLDTAIILADDADTPIQLVGKKGVPILQKADGTHMTESLAIVRYLDTLDDPLLSNLPDAAIEAWLPTAWLPAAKLFVPRFAQAEFAEYATPSARDFYRSHEERDFGDINGLLAASISMASSMMTKLDDLAPLLTRRTSFSLSDVRLFPMLRSLTIARPVAMPGSVRDYIDRISFVSGVTLFDDQAI